ncbi:MAG: ABC transporter permease [Acidobacteria bacterium]|nr:ABC transporter permease [Acidobacteriota bacterium]
MHLLRYTLDEAAMSLWRGRRSSLLSTATIAIALFVTGAFLVVTSNLERLAQEWSGAAEMSVYLADQVTGTDRASIERTLRAAPVVLDVQFVSKEQALGRFRQTFPDLAGTLGSLDENPLPASLEVRLQSSADAQQGIDALVSSVRTMSGVSDVRYDKEWLDRLLRGLRVLRVVGFSLAGALILAAALTIGNVVRLALNARHDEIEIMHLVGAPTTYVRGPFVMEGALHGGLGALVALVALAATYALLRTPFLVPLASALNLSTVRFLPAPVALSLLAGGLGVGALAGVIASRRA